MYCGIVERLAGKAYKGLHTCCPAQTSASFGAEATTRTRTGGPNLKEHGKPQRYSMTRDVRKEIAGSYSALKEKQECAGEVELSAQVQPVDPNTQAMKWR